MQVESAVIANSDTRGSLIGAGAGTSGWGNRNSGIGIRSKAAGRFLIGVWDVHYDEMYKVDPGWLIVNSGAKRRVARGAKPRARLRLHRVLSGGMREHQRYARSPHAHPTA